MSWTWFAITVMIVITGNSTGEQRWRIENDIILPWRYNEREGVSNHRRLDCLLNLLFRRRSKKTLKLRVTGFCEGNPSVTGGFPHEGPVTRNNVSFDDAIMNLYIEYSENT